MFQGKISKKLEIYIYIDKFPLIQNKLNIPGGKGGTNGNNGEPGRGIVSAENKNLFVFVAACAGLTALYFSGDYYLLK